MSNMYLKDEYIKLLKHQAWWWQSECKVIVPAMAKSVERTIDDLGSGYNISATPTAYLMIQAVFVGSKKVKSFSHMLFTAGYAQRMLDKILQRSNSIQ